MPLGYNPASFMSEDKAREPLFGSTHAAAARQPDDSQSSFTLLLSHLQCSPARSIAQEQGDGAGIAQCHQRLVVPLIESDGGCVVKTAGATIMARFEDPVKALKAALGLQQALEADRIGRAVDEQYHIRVGLHTGRGMVQDDDVQGDVAKAAWRLQHQGKADQILITDVLLDAARSAGVQYTKLESAAAEGENEPSGIFTLVWRSIGTEVIEELRAQFDRRIREAKRQQDEVEEEFDNARAQWRSERRRLAGEIEELQENAQNAQQIARQQAVADLHAELQFKLDEALREKNQLEHELVALQARWELERSKLRSQIASMQGAALESMERLNNPARLAVAVRQQVDAKLSEVTKELELQWGIERRRLSAEIERLSQDRDAVEKKEAVRRSVLEKLGKLPAKARETDAKPTDEWERKLANAQLEWEVERQHLNQELQRLERDLQSQKDDLRNETVAEVRGQYEIQLAAQRESSRCDELEAQNAQSNDERQLLLRRIAQLEHAIPEAQEATRKQVTAQLNADLEAKVAEMDRFRARGDRRLNALTEEWEGERRGLRRQVAQLEDQLSEARDAASRFQRDGDGPTLSK